MYASLELNTVYVKFSVGPEKLSENFGKLFSASARETGGPTISSTHPEFIFSEGHSLRYILKPAAILCMLTSMFWF